MRTHARSSLGFDLGFPGPHKRPRENAFSERGLTLMAKRIYILALAGALVAVVPQSGVASPDDTNVTHVIIQELRESVLENWGKLSK